MCIRDSDQIWQGTFAALPAGSYEYLGALNGGWTEYYGQGGVLGGANIPLARAAPPPGKVYYTDPPPSGDALALIYNCRPRRAIQGQMPGVP